MLRLGSRGLGSRVLGFMEKKPTVEKRERERERERARESAFKHSSPPALSMAYLKQGVADMLRR